MKLDELQQEVGVWSRRNFPGSDADDKFLGVVEEVGEWAHARLKRKQGIRGTPEEHLAAERDAMGDVLIYMLDYAELMGWRLNDILKDTWSEVGARDWQKNKTDGKVTP